MGKCEFIVVEGIDGSGKSTLVKELARQLEDSGKRVFVTSSIVRDSIIGRAIRTWINDKSEVINFTQITMMYLSTLIHAVEGCDKVKGVREAIASGDYDYVISDRWSHSTKVYGTNPKDTIYGSLENTNIISLIDNITYSMPKPDTVFYIDVDVEVALERALSRDSNKDLYTSLEMLKIIHQKYHILSLTGDFTVINNRNNINDSLYSMFSHLEGGLL